MKLRNKKTGKIVNVNKIGLAYNQVNAPFDLGVYNSLAELNEDWEDYTPQEPRLKDHAKRKLLRKWADKNCITEVNVSVPTYDSAILSLSWGMLSIDFVDYEEDLIDGATYTIAELCGEGE